MLVIEAPTVGSPVLRLTDTGPMKLESRLEGE